MKRKALIVGCLAAVVTALAAKEPETLEQLKARADAATGERKPPLCLEVAQREIEAANQLFITGDAEKAHALIQESVAYAGKARDSALEQPSKIKNIEIALRKIEQRLGAIRRTLALEDQPDVQSAADQVAAMRKQLLDHMFAPKHKR